MAKDNLWWTLGLIAAGFIGFHLLFKKPSAVVVPATAVPTMQIPPAVTVPMDDDYSGPLYGGVYDNLRGILPGLRVSNRARGCGCSGGS